MKQIFTLIAFLASTALFAQTSVITADFNNSNLPSGKCWINNSLTFKDGLGNQNNTNTISVSSSYASLTTPFIDIASGGTVSFGTSSTAQKNPEAMILVSTIAMDGTVSPIGTTAPIKDFAYPTYTVTVPTAGTYKILIEFTKPAGSTEEPSIDNLSITGTYAAYSCNTAPDAVNDNYNAPVVTTYTSTQSVLANDTDAENETLKTAFVASTDGTVTFNPDGTFTFKPIAGFAGGLASFTYQITDNGFAPLSDVATVTISFPEAGAMPLPIKLVSFTGNLYQSTVTLNWAVEDNETGNYFQIQKSLDGKNFTNAAVIFISNKKGSERYSYKEAINTDTYYRLLINNKDQSTVYSKIIVTKAQDNSNAAAISLLQNPVQASIRFKFSATAEEESMISVYGMNGARLIIQKHSTQKGMNYVELAADALPKGTYVLEVANKTEQRRIKISK